MPPASSFTDVAPVEVDTDQWCKAIASFGGRYATIVAKHVCGFTIWPTKAALPHKNFSFGEKEGGGRVAGEGGEGNHHL